MLVAVMLFVVGWLVGRTYTVVVLAMTSSVIMCTSVAVFVTTYGLDIFHMLITLGYLGAHQSGYLLGAYMSGYQQDN
ncbi:hypothetical protein FVE89_27855 [Methylobacterium sp. 2A]|nr:hypothetical protein [Methylobacterium sp. 2A]